MKRLIILSIFAVFAIFTAFAEDIIVLTNGTTIRAKVIVCSSTEVQYFNLDIPHGPMFLLYADKIALIELNNGQAYYYSATKILHKCHIIKFFVLHLEIIITRDNFIIVQKWKIY